MFRILRVLRRDSSTLTKVRCRFSNQLRRRPHIWRGRAASGERSAGEGGLQVMIAIGGPTGPAQAPQSALTIFTSWAMRAKMDPCHACHTCGEGVLQAEREARAGRAAGDDCNRRTGPAQAPQSALTIFTRRAILFELGTVYISPVCDKGSLQLEGGGGQVVSGPLLAPGALYLSHPLVVDNVMRCCGSAYFDSEYTERDLLRRTSTSCNQIGACWSSSGNRTSHHGPTLALHVFAMRS